MTTTSKPARSARLLLLGAGALTACSLAVGAGALSAEASPIPATTAASSPVALTAASTAGTLPRLAYTRAHLRAIVGKLPKSLKTDLSALKGDTAMQRRAAVKAIEKKAIDGGYGTAVQTAVKHAVAVWNAAPKALKTDIAALKGKTKAEKKAGLLAIEKKALGGGYGSGVEAYVKQLQSNVKKHVKTTGSSPAIA